MYINDNLKKARKTAGMTQRELAEKVGVLPKDISRWENGERTPGAEALAKLCIAMNASADVILGIKNEEEI